MEMERNILGARQRVPPLSSEAGFIFILDLFPEPGEGLKSHTKLTRALIKRGSESSVLMVSVTPQSLRYGPHICVDLQDLGLCVAMLIRADRRKPGDSLRALHRDAECSSEH